MTAIAGAAAGASASISAVSPSTIAELAQMKKAMLEVFEPDLRDDGTVKVGLPLKPIAFQFNPKELTYQKSAKWGRKPQPKATDTANPEYSGPEPSKLSLEMFFDATAKRQGSVEDQVESLLQCCVPTKKTVAKKQPIPPLVKLNWGRTSSFVGFVTSVSAKYTLFSAMGAPLRATCSVSIEEMPGNQSKQNPTSGAIAVRRVQTVVEGDTLASIAFAEYGKATLWRDLAAYNGIDDPLRVPLGTALLLPPPEDLLNGRW